MQKKSSLLITALLALVTLQAKAHYIWIELDAEAKAGKPQEVRIYYGEYNEGVREVKGGRLEELQGIVAWVISPDGKQTPLAITTEAKYFKTSFTPTLEGKYVVVAINTVRDVVDWSKSDIGIVRPVYYTSRAVVVGATETAVANLPAQAEVLITPAAQGKNTFNVLFRGKPLANAKIFFHAPNEWSKELKTDADGAVTFDPLWKGQYIVECIYPEKVPGNFQGKAYEAIRHRATLAVDIR
jgi:uncharacterized GH25 family protein